MSKRFRKNVLLSNETRKDLCDMITREKITVKGASQKMGIAYATAKVVYRVYKREGGRTDKKSTRPLKYSAK